jgi:putative ABC transport system permease protein
MVQIDPGFALALAALVAATAAVAWWGRLGTARATATAAIRAAIQLAVVSLVIVAVLRSWGLAAAFGALMLAVAWLTSARRISRHRTAMWAGLAIVAGVGPTFGVILLSGLVPMTTAAVVPILGILIGGAMTATALAGRRALDVLRQRHGEYEAALALGFRERAAALEICRPAAADALLPALDQTRTVGLVTLPGAFVGVLLSGGSPLQAGAVQLLVLVGLLAAETVAVLTTIELVARGTISRAVHPQDPNHQ